MVKITSNGLSIWSSYQVLYTSYRTSGHHKIRKLTNEVSLKRR